MAYAVDIGGGGAGRLGGRGVSLSRVPTARLGPFEVDARFAVGVGLERRLFGFLRFVHLNLADAWNDHDAARSGPKRKKKKW